MHPLWSLLSKKNLQEKTELCPAAVATSPLIALFRQCTGAKEASWGCRPKRLYGYRIQVAEISSEQALFTWVLQWPW